MQISLIVAASTNNAIGKNNQLLWHLPNDMKFFKNTTWAMPIIMGRKTFESLAGKPLNGRLNIVITKQDGITFEGVSVVNSLESAIEIVARNDYKEAFVIGGGEIYKAAMPIANKIYLTRVDIIIDADTFFPELNPNFWTLANEEEHAADAKHQYNYRFQIWDKKV